MKPRKRLWDGKSNSSKTNNYLNEAQIVAQLLGSTYLQLGDYEKSIQIGRRLLTMVKRVDQPNEINPDNILGIAKSSFSIKRIQQSRPYADSSYHMASAFKPKGPKWKKH